MYRMMDEVIGNPLKWISNAAPVALAIGFVLGIGWSSLHPPGENPTISGILSYWKTREILSSAVEAAKATMKFADETKQDAEQDRELARRLQEDADRLRAQAEEKIEWWKIQIEDEVVGEDAIALSREAQEAQECNRKMQDDAERVMAAVREEVKVAQQAAEAQRLQAEAAKVSAEKTARIATEKAREADLARQKAEECLEKGIQPVVMPSLDQLAAAKASIQYSEGRFHCAITGTSGSGKSSLVNAFRGLHNREAGAAAVGTVETTLQTTRYPSPNSDSPFVWYDIPGAGTLKCPDWLYFNNQGLYVFDCIVVLIDNRFIMTDIAILTNARRFNIPTYIVRSKADQHIQNTMMEIAGREITMGEDEEKIRRRERLYKDVRKEYIDATKRSVKENLHEANLPDQRVYNVSNTALLSVMQDKVPENPIDEVDLVKDLVKEAYARRNGGNLTGSASQWLVG